MVTLSQRCGHGTRAAARKYSRFDGEVMECSESATCVSAAYLSTQTSSPTLLPHPLPVLFLAHQPLKEAPPSDIQSCCIYLHVNCLLATELRLPAMCLVEAASRRRPGYALLNWLDEGTEGRFQRLFLRFPSRRVFPWKKPLDRFLPGWRFSAANCRVLMILLLSLLYLLEEEVGTLMDTILSMWSWGGPSTQCLLIWLGTAFEPVVWYSLWPC